MPLPQNTGIENTFRIIGEINDFDEAHTVEASFKNTELIRTLMSVSIYDVIIVMQEIKKKKGQAIRTT